MCKAPETESDSATESEVEDDFENSVLIRAKWSLDGSKTINDIIEKLYEQIEYFKKMKEDGYELIDEINDDYGYAKKID